MIGTNDGDAITIVGEVAIEVTEAEEEFPSSEPAPSRNLCVIWCCFMLPCTPMCQLNKASSLISFERNAIHERSTLSYVCRTVSICESSVLPLTFVVKPLPQTSHLNGRSLVWLLMWISSAELHANTLKQI